MKMDDNENDVIESMELGTIQEARECRAHNPGFGSKTERAASDFREKAAEERTQARQKQFLEERLKKVGEPETL